MKCWGARDLTKYGILHFTHSPSRPYSRESRRGMSFDILSIDQFDFDELVSQASQYIQYT